MNILKQKPTNDEVKQYALKYMEEKGSFEYSKSVINELRAKSDALISRVEKSLGQEGHDGAQALRDVLKALVLR